MNIFRKEYIMTNKVKDMIQLLEDNGVHLDLNWLFHGSTEEAQLRLLNKIFREKVA